MICITLYQIKEALMKSDVDPSRVQFADYPRSDYNSVIDQVKHLHPIIRVDFPDKWTRLLAMEWTSGGQETGQQQHQHQQNWGQALQFPRGV